MFFLAQPGFEIGKFEDGIVKIDKNFINDHSRCLAKSICNEKSKNISKKERKVMKKIKKEDLDKISYTDFVSLICEENRPSGGKFTIREIAKNSFITKDSKVLEIGCTNGFFHL